MRRLETADATLELLPLESSRDGPHLYPLFHGNGREEIWSYLRDGPFRTVDEYVRHLDSFAGRHDLLAFVVRDATCAKPVGMSLIIRISERSESVEIAYALFAPDVHGKGVAFAAVQALLKCVFQDLRKTCCVWRCDSMNAKSAGLARKLGFRQTEEIKGDFVVKGRLRDSLVFQMQAQDWQAQDRSLMGSGTR
ncbi:GNAT family protein [Rhizobium sp. FKY42]|uniref:GNAT family N-acetyltransferase n=1 Tax=Rhizobium sp. FKY42 TaxID=2562310 RepID=UPI0010C0DB58|nr:GNAT family protein [Rhizobium sp. FKY42]